MCWSCSYTSLGFSNDVESGCFRVASYCFVLLRTPFCLSLGSLPGSLPKPPNGEKVLKSILLGPYVELENEADWNVEIQTGSSQESSQGAATGEQPGSSQGANRSSQGAAKGARQSHDLTISQFPVFKVITHHSRSRDHSFKIS